MKKILNLVLSFGLTGMLVACSNVKNPENVAQEYVTAAYKGDSEKMLSYIYIPENVEAQAGSEEMIQGKIKAGAAKAKEQAERKGGVKEISVVDKNIDEANGKGRVTIGVSFKNEGSNSVTDRVKLIKNEDKWKVDL